MARQASILIGTGGTGAYTKIASLAANTASAVQTFGKNVIFVINADQDIMITFGVAATIATPSGTVGYRIPANQQTTLDMGSANDSIQLYNLSGTTAVNIYIMRLSVV